MKFEYNQLLSITSGIVESARKSKGLSQKELAEELGVIQSTVCRVEQGSLSPTLYHWMKMCELLNIPEDSITIGYLDRANIAKITSERKEGGYPLPKRYRELRFSKVRWLLPLLNFTRNELGEEKYLKILAKIKMKPGFFVNLDNQVNINLVNDLIDAISTYYKIDRRTQSSLMKYAGDPTSHGVLATPYRNANNQIDLIDRYLKNFNKYQRLFEVDVKKTSNKSLNFTSQVNSQMKWVIGEMGTEKDDFLWAFFESYLKKFSLFDYKNKDIGLKEISIKSSNLDRNFKREVLISVA